MVATMVLNYRHDTDEQSARQDNYQRYVSRREEMPMIRH
jgi:hypothetical protein